MTILRPEIAAIEPTGIARIARPYYEDPDIIPLWFGEGDLPTDPSIREAAKRALDEGQTFYANDRGTNATRGELKTYLDSLYGIDLNPDRLLVPGSSMLAVVMAVNATVSRGDRALLVGPFWPNIEAAVQMAGAEIDYACQEAINGRWELDLDSLINSLTDNTRLIYLNSPCNPSGWVMTEAEQLRLLEVCRERKIMILADEVYHRHVYDGREYAPSFMTIAADDDPVIVINGFSKAWAMTGWRLGWMVIPSSTLTAFAMMSQCYNTGAATFTQAGAVAALRSGQSIIEPLRTLYRGGRDRVMAKLSKHPRVEMVKPEGAFYAFPKILGISSSMKFAEDLVSATRVGVAPGYTFGPGNEQRIRIAFACSHELLDEALDRIVGFLDTLP